MTSDARVADRRFAWPGTAFGRPPEAGRRLILIVLGGAALAWLALVFTHTGDGSAILDHHRLGGGEGGTVGAHQHAGSHPVPGMGAIGLTARGLIVLSGWSVMVVAMMLPPALPMLSTVNRLVSRHRHAGLLLSLGIATFVIAWVAVGAVLITGDAVLHTLTAELGPSWHVSRLVPGAILVAAGAYQLSPWKDNCLRACRSPRSFALGHWRGQRAASTEVMTVAGAYALACIGCCWALMAISFAVGVAALPVMVVLALFMAAERLVPWGRRLVRPAGVGLLVVGIGTAVQPFLAGSNVG